MDTDASWRAAGISSGRAAQWAELGFTPEGVTRLRDHGWGLQRARLWIAAGFTPDEANSGLSWRPIHLGDRGLTPEQCREVNLCGVSYLGPEDGAWIAKYGPTAYVEIARAFAPFMKTPPLMLYHAVVSGLDPSQLVFAAESGFSPWDVHEWADAMGHDPAQWKPWRAAGFSAKGAAILAPAFASPELAVPWARAGFSSVSASGYAALGCTLEQAQEHRRNGVLPVDLESPRSEGPLAWSDAFTRSKGYKHVFRLGPEREATERVVRAISDLGGPTADSRELFSSWTDVMLFLDGGAFQSFGYGFGALRGGWVFGARALAIVCDRAGLKRPRWSDAPPRDELDAEWTAQRGHQDPATTERMASIWTLQQLEDYASGLGPPRFRWDDLHQE